MAEIGWLRQGKDSEHKIITAPGPAQAGAEEAIARLEGALAGFSGPKPAWFRPFERLGRWWYLILAVASAAFFAAFATNGEGMGMNVVYGIAFSPLVTLVVVGLITGIAHLQARLASGENREQVIKDVARFARPAGGVADRVETILAKDPGLAPRVHDLAWRAAGVGEAHRNAAEQELDDLWRLADPYAAEARDAQIREIEEGIARLKRDGKIQ